MDDTIKIFLGVLKLTLCRAIENDLIRVDGQQAGTNETSEVL